jgi:hypothetical protein
MSTALAQFRAYFGPMTSTEALQWAIDCEEHAELFPPGDPMKARCLRESAGALQFAQALEREERAP